MRYIYNPSPTLPSRGEGARQRGWGVPYLLAIGCILSVNLKPSHTQYISPPASSASPASPASPAPLASPAPSAVSEKTFKSLRHSMEEFGIELIPIPIPNNFGSSARTTLARTSSFVK